MDKLSEPFIQCSILRDGSKVLELKSRPQFNFRNPLQSVRESDVILAFPRTSEARQESHDAGLIGRVAVRPHRESLVMAEVDHTRDSFGDAEVNLSSRVISRHGLLNLVEDLDPISNQGQKNLLSADSKNQRIFAFDVTQMVQSILEKPDMLVANPFVPIVFKILHEAIQGAQMPLARPFWEFVAVEVKAVRPVAVRILAHSIWRLVQHRALRLLDSRGCRRIAQDPIPSIIPKHLHRRLRGPSMSRLLGARHLW